MGSMHRTGSFGNHAGANWIIEEYSSQSRRADLINRYNAVAGTPSEFVSQVHEDFLRGRMVQDEVVAFVIVCEELITAAQQWKQQ